MSLPAWILPFKEPYTTIKLIKGTYYKYAVTYLYDPCRKRTIPKSGVLLGKITEQNGFVPSPKNALRQTSRSLPTVDIKISACTRFSICSLRTKSLPSRRCSDKNGQKPC